jgi:hypothetical protein
MGEKIESSNNEIDGPSGGDEFMAVKPWLGAIVGILNYAELYIIFF